MKNQRFIHRSIKRDKKLSSANSMPFMVVNVFLGVALSLLLFIIIDACLNGFGTNFMHYIYAALQINYPQVDDALVGSKSFHIISFLMMGIVSFLLIPLLIAALNNWLNQIILDIQEGRKVYRGLTNHYVLVGYNEFTAQILRSIFQGNDSYAIVLTMSNVVKAREQVESMLPADQAARVLFYAGDAISNDTVATLSLHHAKELFLLDESDGQSSRYTHNMTVVQHLAEACADRMQPLIVYMQVNNSTAYNILRKVETPEQYLRKDGRSIIDLRPFNFYENWSRLLWSYYTLHRDGQPVYDPLDFEPLENTDKHVHLVIAGFDSMGQALLLEALRLCHYPNYVEATGKSAAKNKTQITVFDARWEEQKDLFFAQYNHLDEIKDIDLSFQSMDICSASARNMVDEWAKDTQTLLTIAVCDENAEVAMQKAVNLPESVFYQRAESAVLPRVLVRQHQPYALHCTFDAYSNMRSFGTFSEGVDLAQLDDDIPLCINGIYSEKSTKGEWLFYIPQLEECKAAIREAVGNQSTMSKWRHLWLNLSENFKWANRFQVDMYGYYKRVLARNSELPEKEHAQFMEQLSETEHRRWLAERVVAGWRQSEDDKEPKNNLHRIHRCIVPYAALSEEEKLKDYNVIATVNILTNK